VDQRPFAVHRIIRAKRRVFRCSGGACKRIVLDAQVQTFTMFGVFDCGAARFKASDWQPRRSNIFFGKGALWIVAIFSRPLEI
jgi:hypothetical protein